MQDSVTSSGIPKLWQRLLCLLYDFLLLFAVIFMASLVFVPLFSSIDPLYFKPFYQFYLLTIMGVYFIWFWTHGGQTLAMQTWKLRIVDSKGQSITKKQAITRYLLALVLYPFFFITLIWMFFDRDRQFLHDRIAGTRIIKL
ncbi:MAG TPA: RDD family protein [Nitrosomonas sp.]|mgnify:CR=1 FL=1|nr:RDD family protein [Nitrosomonas sp.]HQX13374.1 RDD family protein [Nitrosomonas sp.]HRB31714.1 RDD family protein [Nitrosomonas sp.]HRB44446.1 RDD family protein [Nitrosomonas sp.]HRB76709.1 RDD family protein [Nitrosomonas sp.]